MRKSPYTPEEIATGIATLGKRDGAEFLRERLFLELLAVSGSAVDGGALSFREGRRNMAADLLNLLDLPLDNDRPDASNTVGIKPARRPSGTGRRVPDEPPGGYGRGPRPSGSRKSPGVDA